MKEGESYLIYESAGGYDFTGHSESKDASETIGGIEDAIVENGVQVRIEAHRDWVKRSAQSDTQIGVEVSSGEDDITGQNKGLTSAEETIKTLDKYDREHVRPYLKKMQRWRDRRVDSNITYRSKPLRSGVEVELHS